MDYRFERIYFLKTKSGELAKVKQLCKDYHIYENGTFESVKKFHFAWGIGPYGIICLSPTTFLTHKPDFNSIEELEAFLDRFEIKN